MHVGSDVEHVTADHSQWPRAGHVALCNCKGGSET